MGKTSAAGKGFLLGLDIGGGGGRAVLVDVADGSAVSATRSWTATPAPGTSGLGFDLDLSRVTADLADATREALTRAGIGPDRVLGVATAAMRQGSVIVDDDGAVLLATPNRDARAALEGLTLAADHGRALYEATGRWPLPILPAARLLWMQANRESDFQRARHALSISDWMATYLGGEPVAEPSQAGESLLFSLEEADWSPAWTERLGLPLALFPRVARAGTRIGSLTTDAAEAFGLRVGTPVAVGGSDTLCALLATGATDAGQLATITGTSAPTLLVVDTPIVDEQARTWTGHHLVANRWVIESNGGPMGEAFSWIARVLFADSRAPESRMLAEAARSEPGAAGLLSTLGADVMNASELGLPVGHLTLTHLTRPNDPAPRRHVARAVVEGMASAVRANVEQIRRVHEIGADALRLTGGLARNPFWTRLLGDTLGLAVRVTEAERAAGIGAAMCAGVGAGLFADLQEADRLARVQRTYEPSERSIAEAKPGYCAWTALHEQHAATTALASRLAVPWVLSSNDDSATVRRKTFRPKILVTADCDEASLEELSRVGEIKYASFRDEKRLLAGKSLVEALDGFHAFVTEVDIVDAKALARLPSLRVVAACRNDPVNVDLGACDALGVAVLHAPGRNATAVADVTAAFALMLARNLSAAASFLGTPGGEAGDMARMGHAFATLQGRELWSRTVGLVGLGAVGSEVARRLGAFGARVLVCDPYIDELDAALVDAEAVSFDELLAESDIVSLHAAVTAETTGMIDAAALAKMKPGAALINTARAALINEEALIAALREGRLAGAALDVFGVEPPSSDHPLLAMPGVIATPHVAGNTVEVGLHQGRMIAADLDRLLSGERPQHTLTPTVFASPEPFDWAPRTEPVDEATLARLSGGYGPAVSDLQRDARPAAVAGHSGAPGAESRRSGDAVADERVRSDGNGNGTAGIDIETETGNASANGRRHREAETAMAAIAERFVADICADRALAEFSHDTDVTLQFALTDIDVGFWFRLCGGEVVGETGVPNEQAEVRLKMKADVLDGMFTGRVNPMDAALSGELSFTGDAAKAMTLQDLQDDLSRLYGRARETVGDPGDLTRLGPNSVTVSSDEDTAEGTGADSKRAEQLVDILGELYRADLVTATGGNVSVRTSPGASEAWITPSALFKGELATDSLVRIDLEGEPIGGSSRSPSSERLIHTAIYKARPEIEAVIHCHASHATILANTDSPFLPVSTEAAFFGDIPRVPFIMPGTSELADAVAEALGDGWAVLMKNHGLIVAGRSLRRAADSAEIIERSSEVILGCRAVGTEPPVLPADVVATLRKMGDLIA